MTLNSVCFAAVLFLAAGRTLLAEDLEINKFEEVKDQKETPAKVVYLKVDGLEGQKVDAGVVPAIKVELSPMPKTALVMSELLERVDHPVMQEITTSIMTKDGRVGVDVWASSDFKRAPNEDASSKVGEGDFNGFLETLPDMDFWIIEGTKHTFFSYLKPGKWTHVEGKFQIANGEHLEFHVPPGKGFIYLKDFVLKP